MTDTYKTVFGESTTTFTPSEIQQHGDWGCAVKCQSLIMNKFGLDISEEQLTREGLENGWYIDGAGTPLSDVGKLLNLHGIDTIAITNANQYTLMHELAQGHQVIVGVDAFELDSNLLVQFLSRTTDNPNHAILVTGIDATDPENVQVIVTDPGSGEFTSYPWNQFAEAWGDSQFHMVATTEPPPSDFSQQFDVDFTSSLLTSAGITPEMYEPSYSYADVSFGGDVSAVNPVAESDDYEMIVKSAMSADGQGAEIDEGTDPLSADWMSTEENDGSFMDETEIVVEPSDDSDFDRLNGESAISEDTDNFIVEVDFPDADEMNEDESDNLIEDGLQISSDFA